MCGFAQCLILDWKVNLNYIYDRRSLKKILIGVKCSYSTVLANVCELQNSKLIVCFWGVDATEKLVPRLSLPAQPCTHQPHVYTRP